MAKYVDAEAVKKAVVEAVDNGLAATSQDLVEIIEDIPAADVEPVRHGKYISTGYDEVYCDFGVCSLCGHEMMVGSNYCPNCGAKMGKEAKEDGAV